MESKKLIDTGVLPTRPDDLEAAADSSETLKQMFSWRDRP